VKLHPHAKLRHLMDAALDWAQKHGVQYHLKLRFPDGFRFEQRWPSPKAKRTEDEP
jgi:hypothetical protein